MSQLVGQSMREGYDGGMKSKCGGRDCYTKRD